MSGSCASYRDLTGTMVEPTIIDPSGIPSVHGSPRMAVRVIIIVIAGMIVVIAWAASQILSNDIRIRAESLLDIRASRISEVTKARELTNRNLALAGRAFVYSSQEITNQEWRLFVDSLRVRDSLPGFVGMLLVQRGAGDTYRVRYGEPSEQVPVLGGRDIFSDDAFRAAMQSALDHDDFYTRG